MRDLIIEEELLYQAGDPTGFGNIRNYGVTINGSLKAGKSKCYSSNYDYLIVSYNRPEQ